MAIVINGSGTITGISTGGLPDGIVDDGTLATSAVTSTKIADGTILNADINASAAIAGSKVDGSFGKVLQVVSAVDTTQTAVSSNSWTDIGLSATLTPQTGSKVLISFNLQAHLPSGNYGFYVRLLRNTSGVYSNSNTDPAVSYYDNSGTTDMRTKNSWSFLDSSVGGDGSTSMTYKVQARTVAARTVTFSSDSASCEMTLLEIGA